MRSTYASMRMVRMWLLSAICLQLYSFASSQIINADPVGFINIDCGIANNTSYVDSATGLTYVSDDQYIQTGVNGKISSEYKAKNISLETLRSFPDGTKNCYTLTPVSMGSKYLVRALFYYGNYDKSGKSPRFDLYFGVNFWNTVQIDFSQPSSWYYHEIIGIAPANYIQICLVNTGRGTPFISTLELRPLNSTLYQLANSTHSLKLHQRRNVQGFVDIVRYPHDLHDRLWFQYNPFSLFPAATISHNIDGFTFDVPSVVLQTGGYPLTLNESIELILTPSEWSTTYLIILHTCEVRVAANNTLNEYYLYNNGVEVFSEAIPVGHYLQTGFAYYTASGSTIYNVSLKGTATSSFPPILNAYEVYAFVPVEMFPTDSGDVTGINLIKANYRVSKGWSGDPCAPTFLSWNGVNCTIDSSNTPRITVLNLSSSGLNGPILSAFGFLMALKTLDLSHNNLWGDIPTSLDQLELLTFLDLSGNGGLSRTLPPGLRKRQNAGLLTVLFDSIANEREHKKSSKPVILVIVAVVIVLLVGAVALLFLYLKKQKSSSNEFAKKQFSYADLKVITNDFNHQIGTGGFGEVFRGLENEKEVAVKVRSESSSQGVQQFLNEVEKLSRVHHKNLVSLIGYCKDRNHIALVYEYMQEGNLQDRLRGNGQSFPWKQRLRIAYESAQGLEYLHKMCDPPLIHRDVKTSNILLTANLEAKISDFGLVRTFTRNHHVSTKVIGTPGYLDPCYASTSQLTEKSDVYSFGVVLLEIITGKSPIYLGPQRDLHLTQFVQQSLSKGNIESILDPNMGSQYNLNSIWKVAELALRCTDHDEPTKRPTTTEVVMELKESLDLEISYFNNSLISTGTSQHTDSGDEFYAGNIEMARMGQMQVIPDSGPLAR